MKRIRDRPGKAGICAGRLAAKKKKRRCNDTKELLYMKKKGLAIFALAAVMSLGAMGITAFAAGWSQEGSNWVYYNNNGSKVTNAWR